MRRNQRVMKINIVNNRNEVIENDIIIGDFYIDALVYSLIQLIKKE